MPSRLFNQTTRVADGSRLRLTLAGASTAQSPSNQVYVDLRPRAGATIRASRVRLTLPALAEPITR